ncbi:hypothetical protein FOCC_FOCC014433 [Frankliniella occidentalis]|uniref:Deubiquitinase OTUD6B-like n=1 Tax=Frankliniella occidentalis TaxID=133901 RepID=A0A6J1TCL8_FRAOC|nr:deubiquitinase OTUD6B-like [Frankliniella occidentalis]KAE8740065.1 hypothetical protein FOCC_FOCC014433 [Frankliniella occidentalis]
MADNSEESEMLDALAELEKKFKQERKELQARIQGLKKSATKGDKKKKKEVQEEIVNLEADLERRHKEEEDNLKKNSAQKIETEHDQGKGDENVLQNSEENVPSSARVSKAEKRRQKKVAASKDRDARILEQEDLNLLGPRHKEMIAIVEKLKKRGLAIHTIVADGNCLYSAVEHQLKETDSEHAMLDYKMIRKLTADYLRNNRDEFLPFLSNQDTGDAMSETEFDAYCQKVEKTTAWGGQIELRAISDSLKCPIEVIQAVGPPMTIGEPYLASKKPLIVTFHRYLYRLGEHYNSVGPYVEDEPEN